VIEKGCYTKGTDNW